MNPHGDFTKCWKHTKGIQDTLGDYINSLYIKVTVRGWEKRRHWCEHQGEILKAPCFFPKECRSYGRVEDTLEPTAH